MLTLLPFFPTLTSDNTEDADKAVTMDGFEDADEAVTMDGFGEYKLKSSGCHSDKLGFIICRDEEQAAVS